MLKYIFIYTVMFFFIAEPRLWFHHVLESGRGGPGAGRPLPLTRRQEDRPQARHAQVQVKEQQDQEDLCGRREPGDQCGGGQIVL